ncbi:ribonuclease E inhibitor RraB [Ectobacillus antri]|jgi:regulator of RNase E activity RraB|uniref:ribonuclease E inhibitor RraB n=1 Tax=Ectobacillus antri TaxID=2486280 RepID=UPI000F593F1A|nr:ribonuclease E inhibitor RraB [Ectobacillus antri]
MLESQEHKNWREERDLETIASLKEAGSNIFKIHYLQHYFFPKTEEMAHKVAKTLFQEGFDVYEPFTVTDEDGTEFLVLKAGKNSRINAKEIFELTRFMTELAIKELGQADDYDGWETQVIE